MKKSFFKIFGVFGLISLLFSPQIFAQEKRVGLAVYEIVSGENIDYLKKAIREALSASLKEKGPITLVLIDQTEEEIKKKGIPKILKSQDLAFLIVGSAVKLGAPVQINTRLYGPTGNEEPVLLSITVESLDKLLPALKNHAQALYTQINQTAVAQPDVTYEKKVEVKKEVVTAPPPSPPPSATKIPSSSLPNVREEPVKKKEEVVEKTVVVEEKTVIVPPPSEKKGKKGKPIEVEEREVVKEVVKETVVTNPDYLWVSDRLPYEGRGLAYDDVDGDGKKEVITIDLNHVYVYSLVGRQLKLLNTYNGKGDDHYVRVYTMDLDGDGKMEILVSSIRQEQAASLGLKFSGGLFQPVFQNSPWLLKVISWQGKPTLVGEAYYGREVERHSVRGLNLVGDRLKETGEIPLPGNIGIYGLTDFKTTAQESPGLLYLTPSGSLKIYDDDQGKYKKRWSSSERYGGSSNWINQKVRNFFNEVEDGKTYINIDPVSWLDGQGRGAVVVAKNDNFLKNIIGTRPIVKNCWFTRLQWEDLGLRELWSTRKVDGYIADYSRVQLPEGKNPQLLTLLWLRDPGLGAMGTFKSVLAVYDL